MAAAAPRASSVTRGVESREMRRPGACSPEAAIASGTFLFGTIRPTSRMVVAQSSSPDTAR